MEKENRPSWDDYFLSIAYTVASRSSCLTRQIGAILVQGKQIISTGYNGTPKGIKNCNEGGCVRCGNRMKGLVASGESLDKCSCCHAEENAIVQAALHGIRTEDTTLYTTFVPCTTCAKMAINAGVKRIVASEDYPDELGTELLNAAGVELIKHKKNE